jgi:hypothetical protein
MADYRGASYADSVSYASGENAYAILAIVTHGLRHEPELKEQFFKEATSGDYEHLNEVCLEWAEALDNDSVEDLRA